MAPETAESAGSALASAPYLVLARKYRPQKFADLTGQEHVVRTLANALKTGRVAHAFLFCGPRGCGKTTSARILARALNCVNLPRPAGASDPDSAEPCGTCAPCLEIAAGTDIDVQEIDAASNNGVDDVRALREAARYLPARDRYKIYIVDEVHMLSSAAFNALLKTLEEPPGHIKFLLATTDPQKLPATILSRVQRHNFQLVPLGKIVARLREILVAEKVSASDGALSLVARQAAGSMRDALSLLDQLLSAHDPAAGEIGDVEAAEILGALDRRVAADAVTAVLRRDAAGALAAVVRAYEAGAEMKRFAEELAAHARNLLLVQMNGVTLDLPDHELRELKAQGAECDPAQLARVFELLQAAQDEVARAATPRHAIEVALLRAVHLAPSSGLPELIARVEQLAGKLGGAAIPAGVSPEGKPRPSTPPWGSRGLPGAGAPLVRAEAALVASEPTRTAAEPSHPIMQAGSVAPRSVEHQQLVHQASPPAVSAARAMPPAPASTPPASFPPPVAPAVATAPTALDVASRSLEENWKRLVESVRAARKAALAAVLEQGVPQEITADLVSFTLPRAQARAGLLDDRDNRAALEIAFERALGKKPQILIREQVDAPEGAPKSLAEQKREVRARASNARVALGREHPHVRAAVEIFAGEIEDVRDLGEE